MSLINRHDFKGKKTYVLLGQVDGESLKNFSGVTTQGTEKRTVTVHDDETELLVRLQQLAQCFGVELVITEVERSVDGLEGLEVDVNLPLLSLRCDNFTTVDDQTIRGNLVVQLEALLGGSNGRQDGESIHSRLDVGGGTLGFAVSRRSVSGGARARDKHTYSSANIFAAREI